MRGVPKPRALMVVVPNSPPSRSFWNATTLCGGSCGLLLTVSPSWLLRLVDMLPKRAPIVTP
ncbi:hypothetical protein HaLaN_32062, partial [Haematococcus lacustris]